MQVAEGVPQFKIPMRHNPLGYTYSYLLEESMTLIDAGMPSWDAFSALEKQLSELETRVKDLERIIITHMHNDHVGLISYIRERADVKTLAHRVAEERQQEQIRVYKEMYRNTSEELQLMGGGSLQQFLSRFEHAFREDPQPLRLDQLLEDGNTLDLPDAKTTDIWPPGHESNFPNLPTRVAQLKQHHQTRLEEVKTALHSGKSTVYEIAGTIHWDSRPWMIMDFWTKRMAAAETYAHLTHLKNKGEISETTRDSVIH